MFFTETNTNDSLAKHNNELLDDCKDIHKNTTGLALGYNVINVNAEVIDIHSVLKVLLIELEKEKDSFYWFLLIIFLVDHMPGPYGTSIENIFY